MRLIRTIAAGIAIVLGLACVSLAAFGADAVKSVTSGTSTDTDAPRPRAIRPLDPNAGNTETRILDSSKLPDPFVSEFGQRGKHEVRVTITGSPGTIYLVTWRGVPEPVSGTGSYSDTREVTGGFPLVQVAIGEGRISCTVTIDDVEKERRATSPERPIEVCSA